MPTLAPFSGQWLWLRNLFNPNSTRIFSWTRHTVGRLCAEIPSGARFKENFIIGVSDLLERRAWHGLLFVCWSFRACRRRVNLSRCASEPMDGVPNRIAILWIDLSCFFLIKIKDYQCSSSILHTKEWSQGNSGTRCTHKNVNNQTSWWRI